LLQEGHKEGGGRLTHLSHIRRLSPQAIRKQTIPFLIDLTVLQRHCSINLLGIVKEASEKKGGGGRRKKPESKGEMCKS
jgi:hypothetical protein